MNVQFSPAGYSVIKPEEWERMPPSKTEPEGKPSAKWAEAIAALRQGETISVPCTSRPEFRSTYMSLVRAARKHGLFLQRRWNGQQMAVRVAETEEEDIAV